MIIFGIPEEFGILKPHMDVVLNFNSLIEGVDRLDALNPYWQINGQIFQNEYQFDIWYVSYLNTSQQAFRQLVDLLRIAYNGYNVYILCDFSNEIGINLIEGLIKYITDTYGYICNIVKSMSDIPNIKEGTFSIEGIERFDDNMETYKAMFGTDHLESIHGDLA